jgi:hypothetical protein
MATATLTYNLPEDHDAFLAATHSSEAFSLLYELDNHLRQIVKHGTTKTPQEIAEYLRGEINQVLDRVRA